MPRSPALAEFIGLDYCAEMPAVAPPGYTMTAAEAGGLF